MPFLARIREWIDDGPGTARGLVLAALAVAVLGAACEEYIAGSEALAEPRVIGFDIEPDTLDLTDAGDTAVVTVGARAGAGIDSVTVIFRGPGGDAQRRCVSVAPVSGDSIEGSWSCPLALERHDPAGDWAITSLELLGDTAALFDIDSTALADAGYPRVIPALRRALALESADVLSDTVSAYLDTARVAVRARLTGPRLDSVSLALARGEASTACTSTEPVEGERGDGNWGCDVVIPEGAPPGDWTLAAVTGFPMGLDPVAFGPDSLTSFGPPAVTVATPPVDFVVVILPRDTLTAPGDTTRADATAYDSREVAVEGVPFAWSSSDSATAVVDSAGLVTALSEGSAWIRATTSGVTDSAEVVVRFPSPIDSVAVTPAADTLIDRGDTTRFTFAAWDTTGAPLDTSATWWVGDTTVAGIDSTGLATARTGGETTVFAAVGEDTATATLRVEPIAFITLAPYGTTYRAVADTFTYDVTFYGRFERIIDGIEPVWSSSDPSVATVDSSGRVAPLQPGTTTITVEAEDSTESRTVEVVDVAAIDVTPDPFAFDTLGQIEQFTATATDPAGDTVQVTVAWSTTDTTVVTASPGGYVTAEGRGTAAVRATAGTVSGEASVAVLPVDSVALTPAADTVIDRGDTTRFAFEAYTTAGTPVDVTPSAWWSSDTTVATVDSTGLATSVAGGTATISAAAGADTATATLTVPPILYSFVSPYTDSLYALGDTVQYSITSYTPMERTIGGLTPAWSSSDPGVATIDSSGVATATGAGTTTITAVVEDDTTTRSLWVVPVDTVVVSPDGYYFEFYLHERQFTATALSASGDTIDAAIEWSSSDTTRVTITAGGLATAVGHGTPQLTAGAGSVTSTVDVVSDVVTSIVIDPSSDTIAAIDDTTHLTATGYANETTPVPADFWWSSSDPAVATVDSATGVVTAVDSGTVYIRATSLNDVDSARVDVVVSPPPFTYTELGYLGAAPASTDAAYAINDNGWIVGRAQNDAGNNVAFVYTPETGIQEIGTFPDPSFAFSIAWDINENNVAVGQSGHSDGDQAAFYWTAADGMVDIGDLAGRGAQARGVNDSMQIVGDSETSSAYPVAFLWDPGTEAMTSLGTLGGDRSIAWDINNNGVVVGNSQTASGDFRAFVWTQDGGMVDLGTLGGPNSYAFAINEDGVVIGNAENAEGNSRAVVWLPPYGADNMVEVGTYEGPESGAYDANSEVAVGWAETGDGTNIGVAFAETVVPIEINGMFVNTIRGINSLSQMVATVDIDGVNTMIRIDPN